MCTVTWLKSEAGYQVFFNRDERRSRKPALPPRTALCNGVRFAAPIDGDHGGTWMAVNEWGLTLCLLNHYPASAKSLKSQGAFLSRGSLVTSMMDSRSTRLVRTRLESAPLDRYPPFLLLAFSPQGAADLHCWDGLRLGPAAEARMPVTTSSYDSENVVRRRKQQFAALQRQDADALTRFHLQHDPSDSASSVFMSRPDAQTVSFSRVIVDAQQVEFRYQPRKESGTGLDEAFRLQMARRASS